MMLALAVTGIALCCGAGASGELCLIYGDNGPGGYLGRLDEASGELTRLTSGVELPPFPMVSAPLVATGDPSGQIVSYPTGSTTEFALLVATVGASNITAAETDAPVLPVGYAIIGVGLTDGESEGVAVAWAESGSLMAVAFQPFSGKILHQVTAMMPAWYSPSVSAWTTDDDGKPVMVVQMRSGLAWQMVEVFFNGTAPRVVAQDSLGPYVALTSGASGTVYGIVYAGGSDPVDLDFVKVVPGYTYDSPYVVTRIGKKYVSCQPTMAVGSGSDSETVFAVCKKYAARASHLLSMNAASGQIHDSKLPFEQDRFVFGYLFSLMS